MVTPPFVCRTVPVWSSSLITKALGAHLSKHDLGRGVLRSAYERGVPVYVPAFSDSELGLDTETHLKCSAKEGTGIEEILEATSPLERIPHDEHRPAVADDVHGARDGTRGDVVGDVGHVRNLSGAARARKSTGRLIAADPRC